MRRRGAPENRERFWNRDYSSHSAYTESVEPNRERFRKQIGCLDARLPIEDLSYVATTRASAQITEGENYTVSRVRWQVFDEVEGEGLLLDPMHNVPVVAQVVALPDADWTPEMIGGCNRRSSSERTVCAAFSKGGLPRRCSTPY